MFIWRANGSDPVEIKIKVRIGAAWFTLSSVTAHGGQTDLKRTDDTDADGDAFFKVTPADDLLFKLQVKCAVTNGADAKVVHVVEQDGEILPCQNEAAEVVNGSGPYGPVELGVIKATEVKTYYFQVWK